MPGKRKRGIETPSHAQTRDPQTTNAGPISAIAAARLKAAALASAIDGTKEEKSNELAKPSDSDHVESESEEELPTPPLNFKLCTWRETGSNVLSDSDSELTISLNKHSTVSLIGCYELKVLKGAVNIHGANFGAVARKGETTKTHRVFVPSIQPIAKVKGLDRENHVQFISCREPTPFWKISPLFVDIWSSNFSKRDNRSFSLITESNADLLKRPLLPESIPDDWTRVAEECAANPSVILIIGPPSSGKSTFARRLLNRYLTGFGKTAKALPSVCYLDLDASKPEYTPPGQVSLTLVREPNLGPSFTHPSAIPGNDAGNTTIAAHHFPVHSLTNYEEYFYACAKALLHTYQKLPTAPTTIPLIINTPSSLYATHFPQLINQFLPLLRPTHLIHLHNTTAIDPITAANLDALQISIKPLGTTTTHSLTAQSTELPPPLTDAQLRTMHTQSYFHFRMNQHQHHHRREALVEADWDPRPLTHLRPWTLTYEETRTHAQSLTGILTMCEPVPAGQLHTLLNGSIVHIVQTTSTASAAKLVRTPRFRLPYFEPDRKTGLTAPLDPHTSGLVCTALVQGLDPAQRALRVLVPAGCEGVMSALEGERTVLVLGCCEVPEWAYLEEANYEHSNAKQAGENWDRRREQMPPWVERGSVVRGMGYLNTVRRVRKFHQ